MLGVQWRKLWSAVLGVQWRKLRSAVLGVQWRKLRVSPPSTSTEGHRSPRSSRGVVLMT